VNSYQKLSEYFISRPLADEPIGWCLTKRNTSQFTLTDKIEYIMFL